VTELAMPFRPSIQGGKPRQKGTLKVLGLRAPFVPERRGGASSAAGSSLLRRWPGGSSIKSMLRRRSGSNSKANYNLDLAQDAQGPEIAELTRPHHAARSSVLQNIKQLLQG